MTIPPYSAALAELSLHQVHDVADNKTAMQLHLQPSLEHEEECDAHPETQGKRHCPARFRLEPQESYQENRDSTPESEQQNAGQGPRLLDQVRGQSPPRPGKHQPSKGQKPV